MRCKVVRIAQSCWGRLEARAVASVTGLAAALTFGLADAPVAITAAVTPAAGVQAPAFDHGIWDRLLTDYVDGEGRVSYARLQEDDEAALGAYLDALASADPHVWPKAEQLAFWINAYNAGTVAAVLQGESAESLLGRGKLFRLWKFEVAGKRRTLDEIEHKILRKEFVEPRLHFAIVCASTSCPRLRAEAYEASRLDAQLDEQAHAFVNDPARNRFESTASRVQLSKIFDWFEDDFTRNGPLLHFVARHVEDDATRAWLRSARDIEVRHLDYDWTLNAADGERPQRRSRFQ